MFWTKERKVLGAVLSLAAGALVIDSLTRDASQASGVDSAEYTVTRDDASVALVSFGDSPASIARQIEMLKQAAPMKELPRDAFAALPDATEKPVEALSAVNLASGFRLTGIMRTDDGGRAIINGKIVRVGQSVDGYWLKSIGKRSATIVRSGTSYDLPLRS